MSSTILTLAVGQRWRELTVAARTDRPVCDGELPLEVPAAVSVTLTGDGRPAHHGARDCACRRRTATVAYEVWTAAGRTHAGRCCATCRGYAGHTDATEPSSPGAATPSPSQATGPHRTAFWGAPIVRPGITITRAQLHLWAGRALTDAEVTRLAAALPASTVGEAIATIVGAFDFDPAPDEPA